jgi:ABC-2 type transport system ATP-binding protein
MILTSHYMEDIERLCKRLIILREGEIVYDGSLEGVVEKYADHKVVTAHLRKDGAVSREGLEALGQVDLCDDVTIRLRVPRGRVAHAAAELLKRYPVADLAIEEVEIGTLIERIQIAKGGAP